MTNKNKKLIESFKEHLSVHESVHPNQKGKWFIMGARKALQPFYDERFTVKDGIYSLDGMDYVLISENTVFDSKEDALNYIETKILEFIREYEDIVLASAYETYDYFLLEHHPTEFDGSVLGSGFNYGSTNILVNCPKTILILAEND